ncbi:MAG TPA: heme ABC transporter ATP-binding protein [Firmicutes bacterium]|nr:heme ABC transporter ATP-binding protein [Bacillota bacterium]
MDKVLEMRAITKQFPRVLANDQVDFDLKHGEIHALVGENGSGKSTLMNILYGLYQSDGGEIFVRGKQVQVTEPRVAIDLKIGMVFQHFMLVEPLTVAENIVLGSELRKGPFLDSKRAIQEVEELSRQYGLKIDPQAKVADLSVGLQQRVEILKALYRGAEILILDEPTAVLTPQEVEDLFKVLRTLRARGTSIVFITHKIKEVLTLSDRVSVLRRGKKVGTKATSETNEQDLAEMMVGRVVLLNVNKEPARPGPEVLKIDKLSVKDQFGQVKVNEVDLSVRSGEVLGIAGVEGNGQSELVEAIAGLRKTAGGKIFLSDQDITDWSPLKIREAGFGYVPEDRHRRGLVLDYSVADNLILGLHGKNPFVKHSLWRDDRAISENAEHVITQYDIRPPVASQHARSLSGGNQQKIVVGREFTRDPRLLICAQPTRGVDVGAIEFIHQQVITQRDHGAAVLLVSAELDEILSLSDRIAVMYDGQIVSVMSVDEVTEHKLGFLMLGGRLEDYEAGEVTSHAKED